MTPDEILALVTQGPGHAELRAHIRARHGEAAAWMVDRLGDPASTNLALMDMVAFMVAAALREHERRQRGAVETIFVMRDEIKGLGR